jgi:hypothetical protein
MSAIAVCGRYYYIAGGDTLRVAPGHWKAPICVPANQRFTFELTAPISSLTAGAGDALSGKLLTPLRDERKKTIFWPSTPVTHAETLSSFIFAGFRHSLLSKAARSWNFWCAETIPFCRRKGKTAGALFFSARIGYAAHRRAAAHISSGTVQSSDGGYLAPALTDCSCFWRSSIGCWLTRMMPS